MQFTGSVWVTVGSSGFSGGSASYVSLVFQPNSSVAYVAYSDGGQASKTSVMRFAGADWATVGLAGFSAGTAVCTCLAFQPNSSIPFVAYGDGTVSNKATVMAYNGSTWTIVGPAGFSSGAVVSLSFAFQPNLAVPYIAIVTDGRTFSVVAFNGSVWAISRSGLALRYIPVTFVTTGIAFDPTTATPYASYYEGSSGASTMVVLKFDGQNWVQVYSKFVLSGKVGTLSCALSSLAVQPDSGQPFLVYQDFNSQKATVIALRGGAWVTIGSPGFSAGVPFYISLAFQPNSSAPYIAYSDGSASQFATVMSWPPERAPPRPPPAPPSPLPPPPPPPPVRANLLQNVQSFICN